MEWIDKMLSQEESTGVKMGILIFLLSVVIFITVHLIIAYPKLVHAWDGTVEYNMDTSGEDLAPNVDISIDTGTRQTIESIGQLKPGMNLEVHDWGTNETKEVEIIKIDPPTGGPVQMEAYDYNTGAGYFDYSLDLN